MKSWLRGRWMALGALPARHVTWGLVTLFSIWVLLDVFVFRVSGGLAQSTFDAMLRARVYAAAPDPRIVVVDIDEASLARMGKEFGRWPWPRDTLATVLDYLEKQQAAAIVWDILFSDADALSPGGDAAFNQAVLRSPHSHFAVVRLPRSNDGASRLTAKDLPNLWLDGSRNSAPLALIPPVLPAVAGSRLGFNNAYTDVDGVLRRYRYVETLDDGSQIRSLPLSVVNAVDPAAAAALLAGPAGQKDVLIAWRRRADMYPRVPFADVFAQADGNAMPALPDFRGKIVIIGSTSPSLHDVHPTPLAATQAGVDSLATVIDNALNRRQLIELPRPVLAGLAISLCVLFALWVQRSGVSALEPALLLMPASLLGISYLTLNGSPLYVDLHLTAGLALVFLAALRLWNNRRRDHWCSEPHFAGAVLMWPWHSRKPWMDATLDRVMDALQRHAPACRIMVHDTYVAWPGRLRWPELARNAAIIGPADELMVARPALQSALARGSHQCGEPELLPFPVDREQAAAAALAAWHRLASAAAAASVAASPAAVSARDSVSPISPTGTLP